MSEILKILLAAFASVTLDNVIFNHAIGTSTLLECAKKPKQLLSFGFFITEFSVLATMLVYPFEDMLLNSEIGKHFYPFVCVLSLGIVYILTLLIIFAVAKKWFSALKRYVHLSAFNCAVLGGMFLSSQQGLTLSERILFALGIGAGFIVAAYMLSINYDKLSSEKVPASFRGFPISILYIGIIAMLVYVVKI